MRKYHYLAFIGGRYRRYTPPNEQRGFPNEKDGDDSDTPTHGSYGSLLFDPKWKAKRQQILHRDQSACTFCGSTSNLHVHHRQYHFLKEEKKFKVPWDYDDSLLLTVCEPCHRRGHSLYKIPIIKI